MLLATNFSTHPSGDPKRAEPLQVHSCPCSEQSCHIVEEACSHNVVHLLWEVSLSPDKAEAKSFDKRILPSLTGVPARSTQDPGTQIFDTSRDRQRLTPAGISVNCNWHVVERFPLETYGMLLTKMNNIAVNVTHGTFLRRAPDDIENLFVQMFCDMFMSRSWLRSRHDKVRLMLRLYAD